MSHHFEESDIETRRYVTNVARNTTHLVSRGKLVREFATVSTDRTGPAGRRQVGTDRRELYTRCGETIAVFKDGHGAEELDQPSTSAHMCRLCQAE